MSERPDEVEEAMEYAKQYWSFGDSPSTQQALMILRHHTLMLEQR